MLRSARKATGTCTFAVSLRSFLKDADSTAGHIEQAVSALREDPERVIEDVRLTPHQVTTLGFWSDATA